MTASPEFVAHRIEPDEITLELLQLLAKLPPAQREGWVDSYIVGVPQRDLQVSPAAPSIASATLRKLLDSRDALAAIA